jgi:hypothetical protein
MGPSLGGTGANGGGGEMKEDTLTMKRILWILTAIGIGIVAVGWFIN